MITIDQIKQLRQETGISMIECKKSLEEAGGDIEKAKEILRKRGSEFARTKTQRDAGQGIVDVYLHSNHKLGVLLDIRCETDFAAKSEEFKKLAHEICLQVAAMNPLFVKPEDVPSESLAGEKKIYQEQFKNSGKPQKIIDEIVEGKLKKYKEDVCLISQPWVKDESKTIKDLIDESIAKIGENITVKRFARYEV